MKILIIAPYFFSPRAWMVSAYKTALALSKKHQVIVVTSGDKKEEKSINPNLKVYNLKHIFLKDPINYNIIPGLFSFIKKIIKKENPDIFLINKHMFYSTFAVIPLRIWKKKVIIQTDTFPGINWFPRNKLVAMIMWFYARIIGNPLLKLADKVILLHEGLIPIAKKYHLNYQVIHNGVDLKLYQNPPLPKDLTKSENEIIISYIGRLESVKGYEDILRTAQKIIPQFPNVKFLFAGNTEGKGDVVRKYQSKRIIFLGHREDIPSLLKITDIFVLASYSEGLPNALMEAMASSCACLASNAGGVKVLIKDKKNGLLFLPGNLEELKARLVQLIEDASLRKKLGHEAQKTIADNFNWDKIIQYYESLFQKIKK